MKIAAAYAPSDDQETEYGRIPNPPAEYSDLEDQVDEVQERFQRRVIELDDETKAELEQELYIKLKDWSDSRSSLEQKLRTWNDLLEGVTPETDFPWIGACYDKETEVLTFQGWKKFCDVTGDDFVYSFNPEMTMLCSYQPVTAIQKFKASEIIEFKGKSLDIAVTGNHRMFLWSGGKQKYEFLEAQKLLNIRGHDFKIPIAISGWRAKAVDKIYGFDAEDWMALLGWYISEGYCMLKGNSHFPQVVICQSRTANPEKCAEIEQLLKRMGIGFSYGDSQFHLVNIPQEARLELCSLGLAGDKRIPRHYLFHSQDLLECLLDSLIKGDGHVIRPGEKSFRKLESYVYFTISKQLADDVQELAQKLGYNASIRCRKRQDGGTIRGRKIKGIRDSYEVSVGIKKNVKVGQLERKVVPYDDFVYCVTTKFHTLFVRRNGKAAWCGNSNLHIPLPKIKEREITATINRSTMRPVPFLNTRYAGPATQFEESKDFVRELEDFLEDKLKNDTNIHATLKKGLRPTFRDGTTPVQIMWDSTYETVTDWKLYENVQDFTKDYPSADDAGIPQGRYSEIVKLLAKGGKYEAQFEYSMPIYDAPKAYLIGLLDFVHWPVWVPKIAHMQIFGKRVWYTDYELQNKLRMKFFDKDATEVVLKLAGGELRSDRVTSSRDQIEGLSRGSNRAKAKEYQFFELAYVGSLTKQDKANDIVRKHLLYYHLLTRKLVRVESYPIRKGKPNYFALKYIERDGRFLGISLLDDISDLSAECDITHRQRINSRTITHVPSFKAKMTTKTVFDPSRREFRFRPGAVFYLADVNDVVQFDIRPVDLSGSVEDEMLLYQLIDQVTGSSSGLSGQANPIDPRAPARKQQELLRQSSNRIDDYVQNLLPTFEEIGQFVIDLYYQYAPDRIQYYTKDADGNVMEREMDRNKLFNPNVKFKVNGTSVFLNPELEYGRMQEIYQIVGTDPITSGVPRIRRAALERLLMAARIDDDKNFLPTQQELPQAFTTDAESDREAKAAMNREKLAAKLGDAAAKRQHEIGMAAISAETQMAATALEAQLSPPSAGGDGGAAPTGPGAPVPAPGAVAPFPVAPVLPAGAGVPPGVNNAA